MKKSLVLAMAMALGVTASAYAANPFSDVPAGHWAYDSISKLAAAGVVEGYPDGSFKGENLMTRYEMAQIVAKAMAKGANVDALAAEFADELDNLGVRVAALEKKADNVKISGQVRYSYAKNDGAHDQDNLRTRIWVSGQVNEDWSYTAMFQNQEKIAHETSVAGEKTEWQRAYMDGKIGGLKVRAGRFDWTNPNATADLPFGGDIYDGRIDGANIAYGKAVRVAATVGKMTDDFAYAPVNKFWAFTAAADLGKAATLNAGYYNINGEVAADDKEIINIGLQLKAGKNVMISGDWYKLNSEDTTIDGNTGWSAGIAYKGAQADKPGTWGLAAKYMNHEQGINVGPGWNSQVAELDGEGIAVGAYYTIAKNIVAGVEYYNMDENAKVGDTETLWSQIVFSF